MNEEEIFQVAADMPAAERAAYLLTVCEGQPALRQRIERLLASHDHDAFMQRPADRADSAELKAELARLKPEEGEDRIGNYKLLQKIGEGGFGTVWMAEQLEPVRRRVALKIIKPGMDSKEVIVRFEQERQALALMDHPNIAKVLDAGVTPLGRPFFVMELVRGIRITDFCDQNNLPTKERLDLFIAVCNAIQHAHQKGIIHRDIKPSNILVTLHDGMPVPKVIDFGVAKAIQSQRLTDLTFFTRFEQMIGTPLYMSPEQAEMSGLDIDTRSDIYSLGVLLYELLTGRTPFDPEKLMRQGLDEMRRAIREQEPPKPSTFVSTMAADVRTTVAQHRQVDSVRLLGQIRGDLDWIVMKALEKDRTRRYETANGFALDIQRYLQSEPVVARPPTPLYRFQKMVRRNKLAVAAVGAVAAALLVGFVAASWQAVRATRAGQAAQLAQQAEERQTAQARADRDRALRAEAAARRASYTAEINLAFHALGENNLAQARALLDGQRPKAGEEDLRGFEWRHLWRLCFPDDELATFRDEGAMATAFSPAGKFLAYSGGKIIVRETASRRVRATLPSPATTLSFAPHTNLLASGHNSGVEIWNTETWTHVRSLPATNHTARFSPDGRWLLTATAQGYQLWNTQTWQSVAECPGLPRLPLNARNTVAFSPDGQFLITSAAEDTPAADSLRVWRLPGLEELDPFRIKGRPSSLAFSIDGKHLVIGLWDGRIAVWNFAARELLEERTEHTSWVTAVAMAPDGKTFATSSADQTVNLWDATTLRHLQRLRGHVQIVWSFAISPDSRTLASGGGDGSTKLWSADTRHTDTLSAGASVIAGFLDGGRRVVAATNNSWCVWTPESGAHVNIPISTSPQFVTDSAGVPGRHYAVKPDEPLGVLGRNDGKIEVWNLTTGAWVTGWAAHSEGISTLAFSSDGEHLATSSATGEVRVWNFASQREMARWGPVGCLLLCLAFSPDGNTLAASGQSSSVWLWDLSTSREMRLEGQGNHVASVAFSPNGKLLATTTLGAGEARLWELPSGNLVGALRGHVMGTTSAAFSADGKTLATASLDRRLKLWNVPTRQELATFPLANQYPTLLFSSDGRTLAMGSGVESAGDVVQVLSAPSFEDIAAAEAKRDQSGPQ